MSVSTTSSTQVFAGGQSVLTFNFRALTAFPNYINVSAIALTGGTVTALSYSTQYTVFVNSNGVGGTVTVSPTYGTNYNYLVYRTTALLQSSSFSAYNVFPASTVENGLDQLTMIDQERVNNTPFVSYQIGTSSTYSTIIPTPSIGTVLGSDPTGTMFINVPPGPTGSTGATGPQGPSGSTLTVSSSTSDLTIGTTSTTAVFTVVSSTNAASTIVKTDAGGYIHVFYPYIKVTNTQAQNTGGGGTTSGSWQTNTLNTKDYDTASIATLSTSSSIITLPTGTYLVSAVSIFHGTGTSINTYSSRLYNSPSSSVLLTGTAGYENASNIDCYSFIKGLITIVGSTNIILQYQVTNSVSTYGLGYPSNFGPEVYATVEFTKIA